MCLPKVMLLKDEKMILPHEETENNSYLKRMGGIMEKGPSGKNYISRGSLLVNPPQIFAFYLLYPRLQNCSS